MDAAVGGHGPERDALRRSEQPAQQTSQAGQYALEQAEDAGQQTADGTTETPQQAHRV
jgi:hypothetical protein